jgi:DNA-binding LytR/AlgR family response regulator
MKLAMCDDDKKLIKELKSLVYSYANTHRFEMVIDEYYNGEALLDSCTVYDMIFLDYQMDGINGMSVAHTLRDRNLSSAIIFMTNYPDFVYESFEVNPFRFFKKPVEKIHIDAAFDDYFKMYGADYPIRLRNEGATIFLDSKDIVLLEAMGKECIVHLSKEHMVIKTTMAEIIELLPKSHFFRVHRGYYLNFNYITKYDNSYIYLKNGQKAPVSKRCLGSFRTAYKIYAELCNPKRIEW